MKRLSVSLLISIVSSAAFAFPTYKCTKTDAQGSTTEVIVIRQSRAPGAESSTQSSQDGSYELSHSFLMNKVTIGLHLNGSPLSSLRAVGDANAGVELIVVGATSVSCKQVDE
jgi:hypothetical protein